MQRREPVDANHFLWPIDDVPHTDHRGKVIDLVKADAEARPRLWTRQIRVDEIDVAVREQLFELAIAMPAREIVDEGQAARGFAGEPPRKMEADESGPAGDQDPFFQAPNPRFRQWPLPTPAIRQPDS